MTIVGGEYYYVAFMIEGNAITVKTVFTGESAVMNGVTVYFFTLYNDDTRVYTFTEKQLLSFLPNNDKDARQKDVTIELAK